MMNGVQLTDGVITLRPWRVEDADEVHRIVSDPEITRFMSIPPDAPVESRRAWLAGRDAAWATGMEATWAVVDAHDERLLGSIGANVSADDPAIAEIGYWMAPEARGEGIATRAVALVTRWAFDAWALARLEITTHEDNPASQRVAEKSGFRREGVLRSYREQHGCRVDLVMYSRLRDD